MNRSRALGSFILIKRKTKQNQQIDSARQEKILNRSEFSKIFHSFSIPKRRLMRRNQTNSDRSENSSETQLRNSSSSIILSNYKQNIDTKTKSSTKQTLKTSTKIIENPFKPFHLHHNISESLIPLKNPLDMTFNPLKHFETPPKVPKKFPRKIFTIPKLIINPNNHS